MAVDENPCCRGRAPALCYKPLSRALCYKPLSRASVYSSLQGACRGGVCRRTPPSVTNLCREMAAQACYKANVFDSLPYGGSQLATTHLKLSLIKASAAIS